MYQLADHNVEETALRSNYSKPELNDLLFEAQLRSAVVWVHIENNILRHKYVPVNFNEYIIIQAYLSSEEAWE